MNKLTVSFLLSLLLFVSCSREETIVEETYPDGSPKRVCIYLTRGEEKELIKETTYYVDKKIRMEGTYKNGLRDGKWNYWYQNGTLWSEGFFKNGKSDGKRTTYYENGKIRYEGTYKEETRIGIWRFYDEQGKLIEEVDYSVAANAKK